jgi:hypothetical protein
MAVKAADVQTQKKTRKSSWLNAPHRNEARGCVRPEKVVVDDEDARESTKKNLRQHCRLLSSGKEKTTPRVQPGAVSTNEGDGAGKKKT